MVFLGECVGLWYKYKRSIQSVSQKYSVTAWLKFKGSSIGNCLNIYSVQTLPLQQYSLRASISYTYSTCQYINSHTGHLGKRFECTFMTVASRVVFHIITTLRGKLYGATTGPLECVKESNLLISALGVLAGGRRDRRGEERYLQYIQYTGIEGERERERERMRMSSGRKTVGTEASGFYIQQSS